MLGVGSPIAEAVSKLGLGDCYERLQVCDKDADRKTYSLAWTDATSL